MYYVYNISIKSQLTNLSIDMIDFKLTKLRAVKICRELKKTYFHYNSLKVKISAIIKDPYLKSLLHILYISKEGSVSQILYIGPSFYFMK